MRTIRPSAREQLAAFARYARALPRFLGSPVTPDEGRARVRRWLAVRDESFLTLLDRAVWANPRSPYLLLMEAAGVEAGDVRGMVRGRGLEDALEALRESGVYVTLDEFKGRAPLERGGAALPAGEGQFDNPLIAGHYWGRTGGSGGTSRRVAVDLHRLEHEGASQGIFREAFGLDGRPFGIWRVIPPSRAGLNNYLYQMKSGASVQRWFNPYTPPRGPESLAYWLFTEYTLRVGRRFGAQLRGIESCPASDAARVASWLAECAAAGAPAVLDAQAGLAVRACLAAGERGLDIAGSFFRTGGEPLTEAKARVFEEAGCRVACHYAMAEVGRIGWACAAPEDHDDVHLAMDKLALIQRRRETPGGGGSVDELLLTTLLPDASKIMINVESGDYAIRTERRCDCPLGALGLSVHLRQIRSHEKLTTEGNTFLGSDLLKLLDEVLPGRFGGAPTDYQLLEEEQGNGLSTVTVVVGPRVGEVSDEAVLDAVREHLRERPANRLMADFWEQTGALRVARREPVVTAAGKILPLQPGPPA